MKKIILSIIIVIAIPSLVFAFTFQDFTNLFKNKEANKEISLGDQASFIVLTGSGNKYIKPVGALWGLQWAGLATSTNGCLSVNSSGWISPSGSACATLSADWVKQTNYGVLNLTASTTIPYWAKDAFYASSTSVFQGLATFGNASTSQISATNSYLGTVLSGIWNGTALGNTYVDDDITLTNITQITNRAITDTTGTLTVARGGTGQTSFGQGWLHSDGTTFTSSTSPTVAYITATSTNATSTFSGDLRFDAELLPDGSTCANGEILKKTGANDWDCASDSTGSAVGTVSTSTTPTIGNLAYWTSTAFPSLLGTVATTTPTMTAPLTYSGTLGSFVGGVAGTFDCTSATGSVKGCLTSADWGTFNSKQATISATWPITLSGAAVGFNGLSTSTAAVLGSIPYFSGVNTFANIATTTLTGTAPMVFSNPISVIGGSASVLTCTAASGSVAGCLSSTDWTTFNNKADLGSAMTGTFDSNNFAGGAIGAGELIYGGSAGSFSELALGTNGFVLSLVNGFPGWTATTSIPLGGDVSGTLSASVVGNDSHDHTGSTLSGIDVSADTNLTGGRSLTLTDDDILADAELYTGAITFAVSSSSLATTTNLLAHKVSSAITIISVDGHCFGEGTTTIDIEQNGTTIFQTGQFWQGFFDEATGSATTSTAFADATVPAGSWLTYDIEGWNVGTPTNCITTVKYTKDD